VTFKKLCINNPKEPFGAVGGVPLFRLEIREVLDSGRHFASASDLLALTVALARILALKH